MSVLIKGATAVAMDPDHGAEPFQADVLIEGDTIAAIGERLRAPGAAVIDGRDRLVIPGLTNAHFHSSQNFIRGRYPGRPLELLMLYAFPFDMHTSPELIYLRTLLIGMDSLKRGVTCLLDDVAELPTQDLDQLEAVFRAYEDLGIRANCSGHVINRYLFDTLPYANDVLPQELIEEYSSAPPPTTEDYLEFSEEAVRRFHGRAGRLRYVVAPSGPQRCTDDLLVAAAEFADRHDTAYHIHVLETKMQLVTGRELYGKSLIQYLSDVGVLRPRITMAHGIWVSDDDIGLIADAGCSIAHNPICNLRVGSGIMPFRKVRDAGINVALGTDQINCNDSASIFQVMHMTGLIHNMSDIDYDRWPTAAEILHAATVGGARSICLDDQIGSLEVGKKADLVVLKLDELPFVPLNDPAVHLVYAENGSSVEHVLVNGEIVVRDGSLTNIDEKAVIEEVRARAPEVVAHHAQWEEKARRYEPHLKELYHRCMVEEAEIDRLALADGRTLASLSTEA